ncbi:interferon alpha/beta receptor 1 [Pyxicephalus adspersus]|uniref:interferon alpha/beta receptor 1 n=1 Tax=Pyxicephalus adspersus TaxID=30357 RepID=UPI003B596B51
MVRGTGLLLLIPLLVGLGSAVSDLEPPKNLRIINEKEKLTVTWDWMNTSPDDVNVNFTVFYQELGMAPSEIPGCEHIEEYYCIIPSELPDITENYTLHVRVETHHGNKQSDSVSFQSMIEWPPIPSVDLMPQEFLVSVKLITPVHPSYANYHIVLQNMNSSTEEKIRPNLHSFEILYKDLKADAFYCLRAQIHDIQTRKLSPFSEARCFTALKGLPENLRVEGVNTIYLLKWDWDYEKYPDVTFSVKRRYKPC